MTNKERVIATLSNLELCDDCLSVASSVAPRQTVYSICRSLFEEAYIFRHHGICEHCHKAKTTNQLQNKRNHLEEMPKPELKIDSSTKPWFWEGNVQSHVVSYLAKNSYKIRSIADTASRTAGKDIIALSPEGKEIWISVKGYPEKSSNVQARHWFSSALFDLILYYGENPQVQLGIALPKDFTTYANLLPRVGWLKAQMQFNVFWVSAEGTVTVE
ncbi:hypothetical protein PaecuDRAFT_3553 [Paenibacillus curdlanolyticus YK9]|uniref:Uncharacterized protein n=1 Tax=Paenibacillus curdlanolyticus YK9 TaxID=717606 RepID=E0ID51_9BACL|nr:hypothetical protein [Paenibacillus curdlanolyticus]EFM09506.1 hypothetical protein PaecuDRAFT_3553 [Paenibacillus curdlanolyticus YK9]